MENREHEPRTSGQRQKRRQNRDRRPARHIPADTAGFTLIEAMVVIFLMGVLAAAIISNWSTFMRHQELRGDAINLHKEILALKARAVENDDTAYIDAVVGGSACTLKWRYDTTTDPAAPTSALAKRVIQLKKDVLIDTAVGSLPSGDLTSLSNPGTNYWMGANLPDPFTVTTPNNNVRIFINPDTLKNDPTRAFFEGRIMLKSNLPKIKYRYCIQKDSTGMKPELYHQTTTGAAWKRM